MPPSRPHPALPAAFLAVLLAPLLCGAALPVRAVHAQEPSEPAGLTELIHQALERQTFDLSTLYQPPPPELRGESFLLLGHGRTDLRLVQGASAFAASGSGLAAGLAGGGLEVHGPRSCATMRGAPESPAVLVGYGPYARYAAAVPEGGGRIDLYDLDECALDDSMEADGAVSVAVSWAGTWLAAGLADGTVLAGRPGSNLAPLPEPLPGLLGVGFGRGEGVLFAVDRSGSVLLWDLRHGEPLPGFDAGPGPFSGVRFADGVMVLMDERGNPSAWDLAARDQVPYTRELARFFLHAGDIYYRTFGPVLRAERWHAQPSLKAFHSASRRVIAVDDLDGAQRCYSELTGERTACPAAPDWQEIALTDRAGFFLGETAYRLADTAWQLDHDVLLARWVEERGWFLWWARDDRLREYNPLPGHLPERQSILSSRPALFSPVVPPPGFP